MSKRLPDITKAERADFRAGLARAGSPLIAKPDRVKYSEDEERDDHGRWTSGGGSSSGPAVTSQPPTSKPVAATGEAAAPAAGGWHEFSKVDWYGLAGAESFPNGDPPRINNDIKVDLGSGSPVEATGVIDAHGAQVQTMEPKGDHYHLSVFDSANAGSVGWLATHTTNVIALNDLTSHGFDLVHEEDI